MKLSEELQWRGFINQTTFDDISVLDGDPLVFYMGVDPSAPSMTIGNLAAAMMVRHFIAHGHTAYLLVGGATGLIGDPDGKKDERVLKSMQTVVDNKTAIARQYEIIFSDQPFHIVDNYDWFKSIGYLEFLRDIGKHVPLSAMLSRDFIQSRLGEGGSGISYAEFSYSLIQGYDFLHLFREHGVTLQLCGADQWGNSIAGVDMIRRIEGAEVHVFSTPLVINKTTGQKFGKSESGAVWLDPNLTSPYAFYQFWLNLDDDGVVDYLKLYTMLDQSTINSIQTEHQTTPERRVAQRRLAHEVTTLIHGAAVSKRVEKVTEVLFGDSEATSLSDEEIDVLSREIPVVHGETTCVEALVSSGVSQSNGEARRLLAAGAISLNGEKVSEDTPIRSTTLLKKGKNQFVLVVVP